MKRPIVNPALRGLSPESICMMALADLWERDIAELKRTKQPGGAAVCRQLKKAVAEIRGTNTKKLKT